MTPTPHQRALGQAQLSLAQQFGVGGKRWRVLDVAGDPTVATATITAYARPMAQPQVEIPFGGALEDSAWSAVAALSQTALTAGRVLQSAADGRTFAVVTTTTDRGVIEAALVLLRQTIAVYRSPAPVGGKIGPPVVVGSGYPVSIYEAAAPDSAAGMVVGLAGGRDEHLGVAPAAMDARQGDEWRTADQRFTVGQVVTVHTLVLVRLTEVRA